MMLVPGDGSGNPGAVPSWRFFFDDVEQEIKEMMGRILCTAYGDKVEYADLKIHSVKIHDHDFDIATEEYLSFSLE